MPGLRWFAAEARFTLAAFGRTRTLNAATYCTSMSSIPAGQRRNGQVAGCALHSLRIKRLGVRVPPSAPAVGDTSWQSMLGHRR